MQLYEYHISWLPWIQAGLAGCLLLISVMQPKTLMQSLQAVAKPIQRRYATGENNIILIGIKLLFCLCTIALTIATATGAWQGERTEISGKQYIWACGIVLGAALAKYIVDKWIQITFRYAINEQTYYQYRSELWMSMSLCCFALLLAGEMGNGLRWIGPMVVYGAYVAILWWKLMQVFGWSGEHIAYTLLYVLHVEVLPVVVAVRLIGDR